MAKDLTFVEGVSILVGTNIGIGILSIAHAARHTGFLPLLFWLIIAGILTTITMLYIAEASLRTKEHLQISGLSHKYIGSFGKAVMFISIVITCIGALIAYIRASGQVIYELFSIDPRIGSFVFFIAASSVILYGLKTIGRGEKIVSYLMVSILLALCIATFFNEETNYANILDVTWDFNASLPVFNIAIFIYSSQYIVPEMARGFSNNQHLLPRAIIVGMIITFSLLALIPLSAIALEGLDSIQEVVTTSWGKKLGAWAFLLANIFSLAAITTSYWALGTTLVDNIADNFKVDIESKWKNKLIIASIAFIPPLILVLFDYVKRIDDALYWPGVVSAVVLSIFPILILINSRKNGDKTPIFTCSKLLVNKPLQGVIIATFLLATIFGVMVKFKLIS